MAPAPSAPAFSVCTLVTDRAQHAAMRASFEARGFTGDTAEFLHLDNSAGNAWDAYAGLARLLDLARGRHVILCHQDVRLLEAGATELSARLDALTARDPDWAVAGNAGITEEGQHAMRITDPHGPDQRRGTLPARVGSLDENFLVVRAETGLRPSTALRGFHFYGTDLCLRARQRGLTAWAIDFHLHHLSAGNIKADFFREQARFERHWGATLGRSLRVKTTCAKLILRAGIGSSIIGGWCLASRRFRHARNAWRL
jgi:hypothetical protein